MVLEDGKAGYKIMKRILIIDDSPFVALQVEEMFQGEEYEIIGNAKNGTEGVAMYQELRPDIVILDIVMPGIDGIETAKLLLEEDSGARIIMLTSLFDEETIKEVKNVGVPYLIPKPVEKEVLFEVIEKLEK